MPTIKNEWENGRVGEWVKKNSFFSPILPFYLSPIHSFIVGNVGNFFIIANPVAGKGQAPKAALYALNFLRGHGCQGRVEMTECRGDGSRLARIALAEGFKRVVICGGDGTINEVVNEVAKAKVNSSVFIGIIPCGRGNDLARALKIPRDFKAAASILIEGAIREIDIGKVGERYFCTVATFGFDAEVGRKAHEQKLPFSGVATYLYAALKTLSSYKPISSKLSGDFGDFNGEIFMASIANCSSYGGGFKISPSSRLDDGKFEVCIVKKISKLTALRLMPTLFWGGHTHHKAFQIEITKKLTIRSQPESWLYADGEPMCATPTMVEVIEKGLKVITP
jgi:diacylglycerol kinase (ATP)